MPRPAKPGPSQANPDDTQADDSAPTPAEPEARHVSLRIPADLAARLQMHAFALGATPSELAAELIRAHVPEYAPKPTA